MPLHPMTLSRMVGRIAWYIALWAEWLVEYCGLLHSAECHSAEGRGAIESVVVISPFPDQPTLDKSYKTFLPWLSTLILA
jgi:hypothetical protein